MYIHFLRFSYPNLPLFSDWNTFFNDDEPPALQKENFSSQHQVTNEAAYIVSCTFQSIDSETNGGAICFSPSSPDAKLLVEVCTFDNCHTNDQAGGAVCMNSLGTNEDSHGSSVINKCCASHCWTTFKSNEENSYGQCFYIRLEDDDTYINNVLDSSIIQSSPSFSDGEGIIYLRYANITVRTVNFSNNVCTLSPSACCNPSWSSTNTITCFIEYCSICNNKATTAYGLFLDGVSDKHIVRNSNFIGNDISGKKGLIFAAGIDTISECTILDNIADPIFYACDDNTIHIINCTISENDITKTSCEGSVNIDDWKPLPSSFMNNILPTFITDLCKGEFDIQNKVTPDLCKCPKLTCAKFVPIHQDSLLLFICYSITLFFLPQSL